MSSQTTGQVFRSEVSSSDFIVRNYLIRLLQSPISRPVINCKLKLSAVTNSASATSDYVYSTVCFIISLFAKLLCTV